MTWTAPATATTGNTLTAAFWNAQVRDNMLETAAATASSAGDIVYADAANSMGSRVAIGTSGALLASDGSDPVWRGPAAEAIDYGDGSSSQDDNQTSYTATWNSEDLPSVTVTTGTLAIVVVSAFRVSANSASNRVSMSFSISGATTLAAANRQGFIFESSEAGDFGTGSRVSLVDLTAGSNTFQVEAQVSGNFGTIVHPSILVIPL